MNKWICVNGDPVHFLQSQPAAEGHRRCGGPHMAGRIQLHGRCRPTDGVRIRRKWQSDERFEQIEPEKVNIHISVPK